MSGPMTASAHVVAPAGEAGDAIVREVEIQL
jgi:hypothetical protein